MDSLTNEELQSQEKDAISSIYGDLARVDGSMIEVDLKEENATVRFSCPANYPSTAPPSIDIFAPSLDQKELKMMANGLQDRFSAGDVCLFGWVEEIRVGLSELTTSSVSASTGFSPPLSSTMTKKTGESHKEHRKMPDEEKRKEIASSVRIDKGAPILDRKSKFRAFCTTVHSLEECKQFMRILADDEPSIQYATHNITAYRFRSPVTGLINEDRDDDGESGAGDKLLALMQLADVKETMVCVSRWYGGKKLGPDRFRHIVQSAKRLFEESGRIVQSVDSKSSKRSKKKRHPSQ
eukprot:TRINITY_DN81613_c0_g1_i1.p1 TRINITY_DN81613_c0_g1~~TRINITY_DN81613_c0_g1_i1.p1  ORF type:complete len:295 (+),score=78.79 TRINITY_DN81613_c0_g1_i1:129-1013(+)